MSNSTILETCEIMLQCMAMNASSAGKVTLVNGSCTVSTDKVKSDNQIILISRASIGGTLGELYTANVVDGVSFDIKSTNAGDTSSVSWLLMGLC